MKNAKKGQDFVQSIAQTGKRIPSINLRATELASEEDRRNGLVLWARLFKAESWEELKMLAQENTVVDQTISSVWQLTQDRAIREQMQRREENELLWESMKKDRYHT